MLKNKSVFFYILIRHWKAYKYFDRCINSVLTQNYNNYKILFIDDASNYSSKRREYIIKKLRGHVVIFNKKRCYSLLNAYHLISKYATNSNAIIINLDGDDWLPHSICLSQLATIYSSNPTLQMTYGDCLIWDGHIKKRSCIAQLETLNKPYPKQTIEKNTFRSEQFLPLHPRTWKVSLFKSIPKKEFLDSNGKWLRFAEDMALFFPMLEKIKPSEYKVLKNPLYVYNQNNPHADVVENTIPLLKDELEIRTKKKVGRIYRRNSQNVNIYYHKLFSLPFFGTVFYKLQNILIGLNIMKSLFISLKNEALAKNMLNKFEAKNLVFIIKSTKLHVLLKNIQNFKILDCPGINIKKMSNDNLYDLMWTLVFCDAITPKTRKVIVKILPADFPIIRI